jgi:hypothetical protein
MIVSDMDPNAPGAIPSSELCDAWEPFWSLTGAAMSRVSFVALFAALASKVGLLAANRVDLLNSITFPLDSLDRMRTGAGVLEVSKKVPLKQKVQR